MTLSLPIKKKYLAEKVEEQERTGSFHERREYKRFWRRRIGSTAAWRSGGDAVFLCGRHVFMANVVNIGITTTPEEYRVVAGNVCYDIECRFLTEEMEGLSLFIDEATRQIKDEIRHDFRTTFRRQYR